MADININRSIFLFDAAPMLLTGERYCTQLNEEGGKDRLMSLAHSPMVDDHVKDLAQKIIELLEKNKR